MCLFISVDAINCLIYTSGTKPLFSRCWTISSCGVKTLGDYECHWCSTSLMKT